MKISLVIPAKGHSTRVKNKNLYQIKNKSLIRRACEKCLECENVDNVYLDTECDKIRYSVEDLSKDGLKYIIRPPELANNNITANDLMVFALHSIDPCDILLQTFCTSPLIKAETIDSCIEKFLDSLNQGYDSFFTVNPVQEYFWNEDNKPINFNLDTLPNSFSLKKIFMETHGLYGILSTKLLENKRRVGDKPLMITIPRSQSLDINDYEDIKILERILNV